MKHFRVYSKIIVTAVVVLSFLGTLTAEVAQTKTIPQNHKLAVLSGVTPVTYFDQFIDPQWSPDGTRLSFSKEKYDALFMTELKSEVINTLVNQPFCGYEPRWSDNGDVIFFRTAGQTFTDTLSHAVTLMGEKKQSVYRSKLHQEAQLSVKNHQIYLHKKSAQSSAPGVTQAITDQADKYFAPVLSPNGKFLLFEGIVSGIFIRDLGNDTLIHVGRGNHPCWSSDSKSIVFDRTTDDGTQITSGDLFMYNLEKNETIQLTNTDDVIEQRPAISPDNSRIAFDANGAIFIGYITY